MSRFIVGLTGGIGSGKTAVSDLFASKGITIVDADVIAREVVEPGSDGLHAIVERFGQGILAGERLDRTKLRQQVFSNPADKQWLNALLHPMIREQMISQSRNARSAYSILSIPLLVENGLTALVDRVLVVDVDEQTQLDRAANRDNQSRDQIKSIMQSQATREQRLAVADDVIDNMGPPEALIDQVNELHLRYLEIAKKRAKA